MTPRRTCEQGHFWEADLTVGPQARCPVCRGEALPDSGALADLSGLLPTLLTSMGDGVVVVDLQGRFLFFNDAARKLLGRGPDDVPTESWTAHFGIFHADSLTPVATEDLPLVRALRGLDTDQVEFFYRHENLPDGVYASVTGRPLRDGQKVQRGAFIVLRDITRQKRNEQELRRTSMYLAALMNTLPDAIYFKDRDHRYLAINQSLARQFNLSCPADAVGSTADEYFAEPYRSEILADEARVMAGEAIVNKQSRQIWADGHERWVSTTRMPLRDEQGQILGTVGLTRDITDWRYALEAVRASEAMFRNLFDASPDAIFVESFEGVVLDANPAACALQGIARDELIGKNILELTPATRHDTVMRGFQEMVRGERTLVESYTWTGEGAVPVELLASHIDYGGQRALLLHVRDVSARVRAQRDLARSEERFEAAVLGSRDGIWDWDIQHNEVYYSPRWKKMLGYEDGEIASRYEEWLGLLHPEDRDRAVQTLQAYLRGDLPEYELEHRLRTRDGSWRWILARGVAFRDRHGQPYRMAGSHTDIHQRKEAEETLRAAQRAAEAANRSKSRFLATVSHELRTPLSGIHGLTELLLDSGLTEVQAEYLRMLRTCTTSLLGLINDILDFSRIDAEDTDGSGALTLHPQPFDLRTELGAAVKALGIQAAQKQLVLACRVDADVPGQWLADWPRLRQILVNLLGNALKFTDTGAVTLRVRMVPSLPEDEGHPRVCFEVRDTGIGIPPDKQQAIFEPFVQADGTMARKYGGTGLGLSIALRLVERMGGRIELESTVGQGSVFRVELPVLATGPRSRPPSPALRGRVALVVESNAIHRAILGEFLAELGMPAVLTERTSEALTELGRREVDVLLVALEDGDEVGSLVRAVPGGVRVLQMMSPGGRTFPQATGTALLPLLLEDLADQLERLLTGTAHPRIPVPAAPLAPPTRVLHVLVAEDTLVNQRLIRNLLEKQGHRVQVVDNGRAAVERVRQETFDAVLMDVSMPEMDGLQATALIRVEQADTVPRLPIIALTAHALPSDREACLRAGMDAYISKPVDPKQLARVLNELTAAASVLVDVETRS